MISPASEFFFVRAVSKVSYDVRHRPIARSRDGRLIELADPTTGENRRPVQLFREITTCSHGTVDRALQLPGSFLSSSLLCALIRRTSGNRVTKPRKVDAELKCTSNWAATGCVLNATSRNSLSISLL